MHDVLDMIAAELEHRSKGSGRLLVGVDGIGASGKTTFAERLAERLSGHPVVLLHVDDFFNPPEVRHARGRLSPEGFWRDAYDYDALTTLALDPLRSGAEHYRSGIGRAEEGWLQAPADAVALVEDTFLHRARLRGFWDLSLYLHIPFEVAAVRMTARGTVRSIDDPALQRYVGAQRLYFEDSRPQEHASFVIDSTDPGAPVVLERRGRTMGV